MRPNLRGTTVAWLALTLGTIAEAQTAPTPASPSDAGQTTVSKDEPIDFERARGLMEKRRRGESLSDDEGAYLKRAIEARRRQQQKNAVGSGGQGGRLSPKPTTGLKPLTEMSAEDRYKGQDGGLYGGGQNQPPDIHVTPRRGNWPSSSRSTPKGGLPPTVGSSSSH